MIVFLDIANSIVSNASESGRSHGAIDYGRNKDGGGHDHRGNKGEDRTRSQKEGDKKRRKDGD